MATVADARHGAGMHITTDIPTGPARVTAERA
jgi:hypothetical protein